MKIEKLLLGLFASFLMAGCSQNDDLPNGEEQGKNEKSYVAVKICSPKTLGSRATADSDFADAEGTEATVTNAHFFFFNDNGDPVNVNQGKNYVGKLITTTADEDANGNTESMTEAIVVLEKPDVYPTRMVVVLNWDYNGNSLSLNGDGSLSQQLINESAAITDQKFIMSSSVYYDNGIVNYAAVTGANFGSNDTEAKKHPVTAYVERLAAKVTASLNTSDATKYNTTLGAYDTGVTYKDANTEEFQIYAKILGWQLNTTNPSSYLIKQLNAEWGTTAPFTDWNEPNKFRSYWGVSSTPATYSNVAFKYAELADGFNATKYCLENTTGTSTKAVFKAMIGKNNNGAFEALELWQWYGKYYLTAEAMLPDVVAKINAEVKALDAASTVTVQASDILFVYNNNNATSYQIHFSLQDGISNPNVGSTTLKAIVEATDYAKNWSQGKTYYFTSILHLNDIPAVIRNHAYQLNVTEVKGLGTPVNGNTQPEIPEPVDPGATETYIAAQINVLSWRLVNNNVTLGH